MTTYVTQREAMVRDQIARRGIHNPALLAAINSVPRHLFVAPEYRSLAYEDRPLPIGFGQTISQPYIVAYMTEIAQPAPTDKVLEIGGGSGYQAAVLSRLTAEIFSVERIPELAQQAKRLLQRLKYNNVTIIHGDGTLGVAAHAPFDIIILTAAAPQLPEPLIEQLNPGGRIILPVGNRSQQVLQRWRKQADGSLESEDLFTVSFVPLRGFWGWHPDDWETKE